MKTRLDRFPNIAAYLDACNGKSEMADSERHSRTGSYSFAQTANYAEALDIALKGWPEGAARARRIEIQGQTSLRATRKDWRRSPVGGGTLLVGSFCAGHPDPYLHLRREPSKNFLRLVFNVTVASTIDRETMITRGAIASAVIEHLELNGYRVKIDFCIASRSEYRHAEIVTLKDFGESLDLDRVVFWLAHPASLRRFGMSYMETLSAEWRNGLDVGHGYGRPCELDESETDGALYLPCARGSEDAWQSPESALAKFRELLKEKGIEI